jgi:GAF domain-containing protein
VLNVEAFQLNGFDRQDLEILQVLAQHAAIAIQVIGRVMGFHGIVQQLVERPPAYDEILNSILESVREIYGLDSGIIYIADDVNHVLRCSAFISEKPLAPHDSSQLSYRFDESALATRVFHTRQGYFSPDPSQDSIVNPRGLQAFQIESPTVGVPLIFGVKVVGVLVAWSHRTPNLPTERHITELEPFARLAAISIATAASEQQRTQVLQAVQSILAQMQNELSREKNLRLILHAAQTVGFDRVRIFQFQDGTRSFVCLDSLGKSNPDNVRGYTIFPARNPYIKHLTETALSNPAARKYDPTMFGISPDAEALGRPPDIPWVLVPLVITGKLYGYIATDNAYSRREITSDSLEYMTLLGALGEH